MVSFGETVRPRSDDEAWSGVESLVKSPLLLCHVGHR